MDGAEGLSRKVKKKKKKNNNKNQRKRPEEQGHTGGSLRRKRIRLRVKTSDVIYTEQKNKPRKWGEGKRPGRAQSECEGGGEISGTGKRDRKWMTQWARKGLERAEAEGGG